MREIYLYIVAATLILGFLMPQTGKNRKYYILVMTLIHIFVSGFRYYHLTGDLLKYHYTFDTLANAGWLSEDVWNGGRNSGFMLFLKLVYFLTNGEFQAVIFLIAVVIQVSLAYMIHRYSPAPWMSFLVWNCMAFYVFGFNAIKQAFAMAFILLSLIGIIEKKPVFFYGMVLFSGFIHVPALIFLPAYALCQMKFTPRTVLLFVLLGVAFYIFKEQFVNFIKSFYYEEDEVFIYSGELGNRFIMILGFAFFSILLSGFDNPVLEKITPLIAISAMLQMLAGFDNIFTRLTDYYFQASVLYLPMLFYSNGQYRQRNAMQPVFPFNARSKHIFALALSVFLIWFYYTCYINVNITYAVDDYTNFRFMWDVK